MSLPYENATSGEKAVKDMQKLLQEFGCGSFGQMMNFGTGELLVQFTYRGQPVSVKASANGYAAAWMKQHPYTTRSRGSRADYEKKAKQIGSVAVYSILRDWIKGQITAVETGILSFEGAFLGQMLLQNDKTVLEHATASGLLQLESKS
ncbi:hypothetical protein [Noviherbaspirillum saxi]|uniref:Uncharacterized protein n=1 Tax=Noviherbaspirillum saxi TaxID=2320863 RepID=A0A3A3GA79_9BURK|nr:hypothetical protein [Noviherbaspirillum saxi]RJF99065.1 hypothetical protein D3871_11475 [Noviherbaspirillum saxi]